MTYDEVRANSLTVEKEVDRLYHDAKEVICALRDTLNVYQLSRMLQNVRDLQDDIECAIHQDMKMLQSRIKDAMELDKLFAEYREKYGPDHVWGELYEGECAHD